MTEGDYHTSAVVVGAYSQVYDPLPSNETPALDALKPR
jgi:hypothetical protein